jgi:hypothetical protein
MALNISPIIHFVEEGKNKFHVDAGHTAIAYPGTKLITKYLPLCCALCFKGPSKSNGKNNTLINPSYASQ